MTVSYSGNFVQLLLRWKGSIWRTTWRELVVFLSLYFMVRLFYTHLIPWFDADGAMEIKETFESVCRKFDEFTRLIPLTFLLGFYVSNVVSRWWMQFECLRWPEDILSLLCYAIRGTDERSAKTRHRIARYLNLACAIAWRDISTKIRLRFPTMQDIVASGLMTQKEFELMEHINASNVGTRWLTPLHWVQQLVDIEVRNNKDTYAPYINNFNGELKQVRQSFRKLFCHDWVCVPLVYTQVAAIATYGFFFFALFGRQHVPPSPSDPPPVDLVFPVFTVVQFLFFVGWFRVGQDLMRPFGLDDDDIELSYILDRNIVTSFMIVDRLQMMQPPDLEGNSDELACFPAIDAESARTAELGAHPRATPRPIDQIDLLHSSLAKPPKLQIRGEVKKKLLSMAASENAPPNRSFRDKFLGFFSSRPHDPLDKERRLREKYVLW